MSIAAEITLEELELGKTIMLNGKCVKLVQSSITDKSVNASGLVPVEFKILIEPEEVEKVSAGGIVMATSTTERDRMAQVKGRLIAVGGNAFEDWDGAVPAVGDSVYYAKYAGLMVKGEDGKEYRLANDKDITAIIGSTPCSQ